MSFGSTTVADQSLLAVKTKNSFPSKWWTTSILIVNTYIDVHQIYKFEHQMETKKTPLGI